MKDIFFIDYGEDFADKNYAHLSRYLDGVRRISNVKGIYEVHRLAAELSQTEFFFVIDADNLVKQHFNNVFAQSYPEVPTIFHTVNEFGIEYGHGGIKLFGRNQFFSIKQRPYLDFFELLFRGRHNVNTTVASEHLLGHGFQRWKTLFRELCKLALRDRERLDQWCQHAEPRMIYSQVVHFLQQRTPLQIFDDINDYDTLRSIYENRNLLDL